MGNRTVRKVPANWTHPTDERGNYIPLFDGNNFKEDLFHWEDEYKKWLEGYKELLPGQLIPLTSEEISNGYQDWAGEKPELKDYMPIWTEQEADSFMMYETTTEGTPLSPAMETKKELAKWLGENKISLFGNCVTTPEEWMVYLTLE